ncbi:hypothetical protein [Candidatus Venteria ishoeyi]|uniref:Lipoprotein n=1 Tax=Candidatus Venteria ishoeyi TaxID=1899563 RepID=A0A1H6FA99_9GAMM|nr:hypothetical protein [Candidatus Venteria ishoeyi]MDM8545030.1 hypothetical protein [Candidatus Venteria ishoeyi]SEH07018.1 Uncharacterised protein [Candidatus Venteria ishoeyi]
MRVIKSPIFLLGLFLFLLQGCSAPTAAVKPVAEQNMQNLNALTANSHLLQQVYEPLLTSIGNALIIDYITTMEAEMIAVVGPPVLSPKAKDWEQAFKKVRNTFFNKRAKFFERYQHVKSSLERGISEQDRRKLMIKEGWIYSAVQDAEFTPKKAHDLLKTLKELRRSNNKQGRDNIYYKEAERRLSRYDAKLAYYTQSTLASLQLLNGLQREINEELDLARTHGQAILAYTQSEINMKSTIRNIDQKEVASLLGVLGNKYIDDEFYRNAAVNLLTKGSQVFADSL